MAGLKMEGIVKWRELLNGGVLYCRVQYLHIHHMFRFHDFAFLLLLVFYFPWTGECGAEFKDGAAGSDSLDALEEHYMEYLGKGDKTHMKIFRDHPGFQADAALCGVCGRVFSNVTGLMQHLGAKSKGNKKPNKDHRGFFEAIVMPFSGLNI